MDRAQQQQQPVIAFLYFTATWIAINAVFWIRRRLANAAPGTARTDTQQNQQEEERLFDAELVSPLHLKVTTSALSRPIEWLAQTSWLAQKSICGSRLLDAFYTMGVFVTVLLMVLCLGVLCAAGVQIGHLLAAKIGVLQEWVGNNTPANATAIQHSSRIQQSSSSGSSSNNSSNNQLLRPVIPGITLPSAHLAYYVVSLAACALIHEAGHAIAASLAHVRIRKMGVFLLGVYPGAFVDLQRDHLDRCSIGAQLRVACAGVWHNALTGVVAWLLVYGGVLRAVFVVLGWVPVTDGVAVVDVSETSPLFGTLLVGSTIYRIDDVFLDPLQASGRDAFGSVPLHRWTNVLTATKHNSETASMGFCAGVDENMDDGLCCEMSTKYPLGESPDSQIFCFGRYAEADTDAMCLMLGQVLQRTGSLRCSGDADCSRAQVCVLPRSPCTEGRVARVYYGADSMAIYAGSLEALWLDVQVSALEAPVLAGWRLLLGRLPSWCETLAQYTLSFSIAFALLNAIPAWHLDGDHVLRLLLQLLVSCRSPQVDLLDSSDDDSDSSDESATSGSTEHSQPEDQLELAGTARRVYTVTTALATTLLAWCVVGSVVVIVL